MEKREPSLVPEWLRSTGNGSGVGSKNHIQSSSTRSDSSLSHNSKSRNPRTKTDVDTVRSPFLDRSSSTDAPRRYSNGSTRNAYRNFNVQRRGRGKDRRMEKDRLTYIDPSDHDTSFPFGTFLNERNQEQLRRSNSMKTRKHDNHLAQGFTTGLENGRSICSKNHMLPGTSQATSSRDFPCLKTEERNEGGPDVPNVIEKSGSDSVITLTRQTRNMAEALLQTPRTATLPQGSSNIQRLEDRALKQSRQLIPIVPSAPKGSVSRTKPMVRSSAIGFASFKHSSMLLGNLHSNYGRQIKPESTKKLVILKPAVKESGSSSPINNSLAAGFQMFAASSAPIVTSVAQTQSRNAFYSALKKTSTNISTSSCIFSSVQEKADISKELVASDPSSVKAVESDALIMERVEKVSEDAERVSVFELTDLPDEKEAEFLKSLGWDENNTEVEPLTDEEIRAFYEQHKTLKPSLMKKLQILTEATEDVTPNS